MRETVEVSQDKILYPNADRVDGTGSYTTGAESRCGVISRRICGNWIKL